MAPLLPVPAPGGPGPRPPGPGFRRDFVRLRFPSPALGRAAAVPVSLPRLCCHPAVPMPSRVLCLGGGAGGPAARRVRLLLRQVVGGGAAAARFGRSEVRALHSSGNPPRPRSLPRLPLLRAQPRRRHRRQGGQAGRQILPCGLRACPGCAAAPVSCS